jgi:hypothetical protein
MTRVISNFTSFNILSNYIKGIQTELLVKLHNGKSKGVNEEILEVIKLGCQRQ